MVCTAQWLRPAFYCQHLRPAPEMSLTGHCTGHWLLVSPSDAKSSYDGFAEVDNDEKTSPPRKLKYLSVASLLLQKTSNQILRHFQPSI